MSNILLDTNILIYLLKGEFALKEILENKTWIISFITEMEIQMKDGLSPTESKAISAILDECIVIEMNNTIKQRAISNAKKHKLKLADSIILATAQEYQITMLTADKTFRKIAEKQNDVLLYLPK
jgi:predicted nucleic acid-binding protein